MMAVKIDGGLKKSITSTENLQCILFGKTEVILKSWFGSLMGQSSSKLDSLQFLGGESFLPRLNVCMGYVQLSPLQ